MSTDQLHASTNTMKLINRWNMHLTMLMWKKSRNGETDMGHLARTRGDFKLKFRTRRAKTSFYQKGPFYRGCVLWNKLNAEDQRIETKQAFKNRLKILFQVH